MYTPIVGIEIHVELRTTSKMFCGCVNDPFHAKKPNIYTCPVCLGMPGALPVANKQAVAWAIKIGLALGCKVNMFSKFDRKHYFYPDLPKGYQISQYDLPLCYEGLVTTEYGDVRITRVHLEEDTGKLVHQEVDGKKVSLVDFNRSSVPLVEIVTEPDIHSPEQAKAYAKKVAQIIKHLAVSDADMEKGSMRLEANISVQTPEEKEAGKFPPYKVEVKNLNSFRYIERAITYEVARHTKLRDEGTIPAQETRGWNETTNATFPQRSKESAEDYRYFPDPDLPPLRFEESYIEELRSQIPPLPDDLVASWVQAYGLKEQDAKILAADPQMVAVVTALAQKAQGEVAKLASQLVNKKITIDQAKLSQISSSDAILQDVVADLLAQSQALAQTVQMSDDELGRIVDAVLADNPKAVDDYKAGKQQVIGFLIGMVKKKAGAVDTNTIRTALQQRM